MKKKFSWTKVVIIIVATFLILFWEVKGREEVVYKDAIALNKSYSIGEVIKASDLINIKTVYKIENGLGKEDADKIIGKVATQFIPKGSQLSPLYFEENLLEDINEMRVMSVSKNWLASFPETIRRGDEAYLYGITNGGGSFFITNAKVKHVKDKNNTEIETLGPDRLEPTYTVGTIELLVIEEQAQKIMKYVSENNKLVITYN